jgi:hypothetical protein
MVAIEFHVVMQIYRMGTSSPKISVPGVGGVGSGFIGLYRDSDIKMVSVSFYTTEDRSAFLWASRNALPLASRAARVVLQQVRPWIEPAQSFEKKQLGLSDVFFNSLRFT